VALIGLSVLVHKQWSQHERLPYPIAKFTEAILPQKGASIPPFMKNRGFWIAAGIVLFIHMNNYGVTWFPEYGVTIPTNVNMMPLADLIPFLKKGGGVGLMNIRIYFIIIGICKFFMIANKIHTPIINRSK